jgi:hypothetical protein
MGLAVEFPSNVSSSNLKNVKVLTMAFPDHRPLAYPPVCRSRSYTSLPFSATPFGKGPVLLVDNEFYLAHTTAILRYLARHHGKFLHERAAPLVQKTHWPLSSVIGSETLWCRRQRSVFWTKICDFANSPILTAGHLRFKQTVHL